MFWKIKKCFKKSTEAKELDARTDDIVYGVINQRMAYEASAHEAIVETSYYYNMNTARERRQPTRIGTIFVFVRPLLRHNRTCRTLRMVFRELDR